VFMGGFLYRKLLPELASRGLEGVTLDLPGLGLADRPADFDYSWSGFATWYLKAIDAAGITNFHLVVHDIGGPIGFDIIRRVPSRIKSLTVLNTLVDVSQFRRPWVMEPFAWPVVGLLWLQSARTPMFYVLNKTFGSVRARSTEQSPLLTVTSSWDQMADERSSRSCGASNGPPPLSTASRPL
jgi:pimeloyl-ACP methyl ester carboxylesterase